MVGDSGGGTCRFAVHTGTSATAVRSRAGVQSLGGVSLMLQGGGREAAVLGNGAKPLWGRWRS